MHKQQIVTIVEFFEHVQQFPHMYIVGDIDGVRSFLRGFVHALGITGLLNPNIYEKAHSEVANEFGWEWQPGDLWLQMKNQGLSDEKIIDQLLSIELESWKRYKEKIGTKDT